jgi:penicillin-binding protein A
MRPQIVRLFGVFVFMFALLIVFTSRWTVLDASSLQNNSLNKLALIEQLRIKRGQILADDGTVLAR